MDKSIIITTTIAAVLGLVVVLLVLGIVYIVYYYPIPFNDGSYTIKQLYGFDVENQILIRSSKGVDRKSFPVENFIERKREGEIGGICTGGTSASGTKANGITSNTASGNTDGNTASGITSDMEPYISRDRSSFSSHRSLIISTSRDLDHDDLNMILNLDYHDAMSYITTSSPQQIQKLEPIHHGANMVADDDPERTILANKLATLGQTPEEFSHEVDIQSVKIYSGSTTSPENQYISDQYDSFSKTLMLQDLLEQDINKNETNANDNFSAPHSPDTPRYPIKRIEDPYLENFILVGGIVVVIKPFFGVEGYEFSGLQPGDLIRIVRIYCKEMEFNRKKFHIIKTSNKESTNEVNFIGNKDDTITKEYQFYENIYCTGVLLNTYLEVNENGKLRLKFKTLSEFAKQERELLKDFPLDCCSLETTLLTNI